MDRVLELPEGVDRLGVEEGLDVHDAALGHLAGGTGAVQDRIQHGIVSRLLEDGGVTRDDFREVPRRRREGGRDPRMSPGDGELRVVLRLRVAPGVPVAEDGVVPLARVAQIVAPGVDEGGQQVGLLEDLVEAVGRILVQFSLGLEIIGETLADAGGSLGAEFREGFLVVLEALRVRLPKALVATLAEGHEPLDAAVEDAMEAVIVRRGDGIVLVVVAPRAADGEAEHAARDDVDAVVDDLVFHPEEAAPDREKAHRGLVAGPFSLDLVGGELEHQKAVVGQVVVQGRDDPVAVGPGMRPVFFLAGIDVALRVRIPRHIEPVPRPVFAVVGGGEVLIDDRGPIGGGNR